MEKKVRNSNHELLRIISMYMIVFIHANMYLNYFVKGSGSVFFNGVVNGICNIGVTCFILISGYYGVKFDIRKLVKMECMMITYSLLETVILYIALPERVQGAALLEQIIKSFLPFITRKYWFYSCYVCLILLSGYIQKFIERLNQTEFRKLLLLLIVLFNVLPALFYFEIIPDNGKGLVQMITIYMLGRYIRMYRDVPMQKRRRNGCLFLFLWIVNGISHEFPIRVGGIYHHLCKDNSITNLVLAVILFYFFKELKLRSAFINRSAGYVFAVFALNNTLVTIFMEWLIRNGFHGANGILGFLMLAGTVLFIMVICLLIGGLRELILGKLDRRLEDKSEDKIKSVAQKAFILYNK